MSIDEEKTEEDVLDANKVKFKEDIPDDTLLEMEILPSNAREGTRISSMVPLIEDVICI